MARDGGVFAFGNAPFFGSLGSSGITDIAGFVTTATGYILVDRTGKTYPFSASTNNNMPTETVPPTAPAQSGALKVSTPEDYLCLGSRLVFSTVKSESRSSQSITVTNSGSNAVLVTGISFGGAQAQDFGLASGQASSFSLAAGAKRSISVTYQPTGGGYHVLPTYMSQATLSIATDSGSPAVVALGGYNAADYGSVWEPSLQEMINTLGYSTNIGVTNRYQANAIGPYSGAAGDEVISAYWKKADISQPISMYPLAHTSGQESTYASLGWYTKGSSSNDYLYAFTGSGNGDNSNDGWGQNQMLLPGTTSGTRTFNPTGSFGFVDSQGNHSDDTLNGSGDWHNVRWYPARNSDGAAIANTWIVADDIGSPVNNSAKNWDYQDYVFLITNATPDGGNDQPAAVSLNQLLTSFNGNAGGVANTGFTTAQGSMDANKISFSNGNLLLATNNDSNTSHTNALQLGVNAATPFKVQSRLVGPFDSINAGAEQQGIYFGPNSNNYIKTEVEWNSSDNSRHLTVWLEKNGSGSIIKTIQLPSGNANTIDFTITVDPSPQASGSYNGNPIVTVSYAVNGGGNQTLLQDESSVPGSWITSNTPAGIVASHQEGGSQFSAAFASFTISRSY